MELAWHFPLSGRRYEQYASIRPAGQPSLARGLHLWAKMDAQTTDILSAFQPVGRRRGGERECPPPVRHFLEVGTRLLSLHSVVQNWASVVTGNCSLYFVQLKIRDLCPRKKREQRLGEPAVSATGTFGAGQSERFLKITALISFPGWEWFLLRMSKYGPEIVRWKMLDQKSW